MNIGIDATCWWNNRGFGRFTRELLTALFQLDSPHVFHVFVDQIPDEAMKFDNVNLVYVASSRPTTSAATADSNRSPRDMFRLYRAVANAPLDIMFFPAVYSWFPVPIGLPSMVTIHDAIAEHYPRLIFSTWKSRLFWTIKVKLAVWSSQRILTVSKAAKQEIVDYMHVAPGMIDLTTEAPHPKFKKIDDDAIKMQARLRAKLPTAARIIAYVGGLAPHKNLAGLLDGFASAHAGPMSTLQDVHLALIGDLQGDGFNSNYKDLYKKVQSDPRLRDRVHFTGFVTDEDLIALYNSALAVVMPAFSEGFGLPAVEAMSCSVPVLASNRGALPEVVGDAGIYFDPCDVTAISNAITQIAENDDLRSQLSAIALSRAGNFSWQRAAELTLGHLEHLPKK
jgi:glycosyltransferase involved in cell wall biosynthesis